MVVAVVVVEAMDGQWQSAEVQMCQEGTTFLSPSLPEPSRSCINLESQ